MTTPAQDLRQKTAELEMRILKLVGDFEKEADLHVESIALYSHKHITDDRIKEEVYEVKVEARL